MESNNMIVSDPNIMLGKPVIKGTRITVELILEKIGSGTSIADLLKSYPHITQEQVYAAILFASNMLRGDSIYPVAS